MDEHQSTDDTDDRGGSPDRELEEWSAPSGSQPMPASAPGQGEHPPALSGAAASYRGVPGSPGGAGAPAYPGGGNLPAYPGNGAGYGPGSAAAPSSPLQPGAPSVPLYPGYPGYGAYPGYPPPAGYPPAPGYAPASGYPPPAGYPPAGYPPYSMPGAPSMPWQAGPWQAGMPAPVAPATGGHRPAWLAGLARALSTRTALVLLVAGLALVAGAAAITVVSGLGDWADAGVAAGITGLVAGVIFLAILFARSRRPELAAANALGPAAALILLVVGGLGMALPTPLHLAQARMLEAHGDWSSAISEYQLSGEGAPGGVDIARVYDEWGDALAHRGDYVDAIQRYETVITTYPNATDEVQRAQTSDAQVRYEYGSQSLSQKDYAEAIYEFEQVVQRFPESPYAREAHLGAAQAYYALARTNLTIVCGDAVTDYQTLAGKYADTPEGAKARAALAAPVTVYGELLDAPAGSAPIVYLSASAPGTRGNTYLSDDYHASVNSAGAFTFTGVPQGKYNVSVNLADGSSWYWFYDKPSYNPYIVVAGPVCPVFAGTFHYGGGWSS